MTDETTKILWHGGVCSVELDIELADVYHSLLEIERNALEGSGTVDPYAMHALRHMRRYIDKLTMEKMRHLEEKE